MLETPVLFFIFNRKNPTQQVFEAIVDQSIELRTQSFSRKKPVAFSLYHNFSTIK